MEEVINESSIKKIDTKLINWNVDDRLLQEDGQILDQYKLLIESIFHLDERSASSNNIFIGINSIFATIVTQVIPNLNQTAENRVFILFLIVIGSIISIDWLDTLKAYKKINSVNYQLIKALEKKLPTNVFSLRAELIGKGLDDADKNSLILKRELFIPVLFIVFYLAYFCIILFKIMGTN